VTTPDSDFVVDLKDSAGQMQDAEESESEDFVVESTTISPQRVQLSMPYQSLNFPISHASQLVPINIVPGSQVHESASDGRGTKLSRHSHGSDKSPVPIWYCGHGSQFDARTSLNVLSGQVKHAPTPPRLYPPA
jgi:hypothetical protein